MLVPLFLVMTQIPDKEQLGEEKAHSNPQCEAIQPITTGEGWGSCPWALPVRMKIQERWVPPHVLLFIQPRTPAPRMLLPPTLRGTLPFSVNIFLETCSWTHPEMCFHGDYIQSGWWWRWTITQSTKMKTGFWPPRVWKLSYRTLLYLYLLDLLGLQSFLSILKQFFYVNLFTPSHFLGKWR